MARRPDPPADPAFEALCALLAVPTDRRSLAQYVDIAQLVFGFSQQTPADPSHRGRGAWMRSLQDRLADRKLGVTDTLLHRYRRFGALDAEFLDACRRATEARWEDVRRLLGRRFASRRLAFLRVADQGKLSAKEFEEVVRLRTAGSAGRTPPSPADRAKYKRNRAGLREAAVDVADQAAAWLKPGGVPARVLAAEAARTPAVGKVQAAVRQLEAAARRVADALADPESAPDRG